MAVVSSPSTVLSLFPLSPPPSCLRSYLYGQCISFSPLRPFCTFRRTQSSFVGKSPSSSFSPLPPSSSFPFSSSTYSPSSPFSLSSSPSPSPPFSSSPTSSSLQSLLTTEEKPKPEVSLSQDRVFYLPGINGNKRVVLVRHGESTWNATGRIQGSSDFSVLTSKGESQAETSRQMLANDNFEVCFHSPLQRSAKTAEIIWASRNSPMIPIDDLREIDLYAFQGLMKDEGKQRFGEQYHMWQKDAPNFEIDGHFPVRELWERAKNCWEIILRHPAESILVVAHNAVNQALVATATGLGPEYFRQLLQSNCGVSVLDFAEQGGEENSPPSVCLNRLNQTPSPPIMSGTGGRKAKSRVLLVCHGATDSSLQAKFALSDDEKLNMLGVIQSRKTAELLLDTKVDSLLYSPLPRAIKTADAIAEVQEAADCLGADCFPRYVNMVEMGELRDFDWGDWRGLLKGDVGKQERWEDSLLQREGESGETLDSLWERSGMAWERIRDHLSIENKEIVEQEGEQGEDDSKTVVVVAHDIIYAGILGHCLNLPSKSVGAFHLDTGSLSVIDFPDGPKGKGIVRCLNYTAHLGRWAVPVTRPSLNDEDF